MNYFVSIRRRGEVMVISEDILDGIVPENVVEMMKCTFVENELKLCRICESEGRRGHIMKYVSQYLYAKYCPVLWHDAFKPRSWKVDELV
jgi:hypothetical protein